MNKSSLQDIGQIAIAVSDIQRACDFYQHILELPLLFRAGENLAFFACGKVRLMLTTLQGSETDHHSSVIYYRTDKLQDFCDTLKSKGLALEQEPQMVAKMADHHLWMAFVRDSEGNLIGLMSEIPFED